MREVPRTQLEAEVPPPQFRAAHGTPGLLTSCPCGLSARPTQPPAPAQDGGLPLRGMEEEAWQ